MRRREARGTSAEAAPAAAPPRAAAALPQPTAAPPLPAAVAPPPLQAEVAQALLVVDSNSEEGKALLAKRGSVAAAGGTMLVVDSNSEEGKALLGKRALHEAAASAEREKHMEAYLAPLERKDELALKAEDVKMIKVKAWRCLECKYFHERALESCRQKHIHRLPWVRVNPSPRPNPSPSPRPDPHPNQEESQPPAAAHLGRDQTLLRVR